MTHSSNYVTYSIVSLNGPPLWQTVKQVNGNSSTGECIKASIIGPIIRSQGGCVVHASSSGVIFHDGPGDWVGRLGLLVQKGLSQQEHEEEPCGYSSCARGRTRSTNNCFKTLDSDCGFQFS